MVSWCNVDRAWLSYRNDLTSSVFFHKNDASAQIDATSGFLKDKDVIYVNGWVYVRLTGSKNGNGCLQTKMRTKIYICTDRKV